ncbi:MAG: hypothetical protein ACYCOU_16555 [Sulfobacillus sp.]
MFDETAGNTPSISRALIFKSKKFDPEPSADVPYRFIEIVNVFIQTATRELKNDLSQLSQISWNISSIIAESISLPAMIEKSIEGYALPQDIPLRGKVEEFPAGVFNIFASRTNLYVSQLRPRERIVSRDCWQVLPFHDGRYTYAHLVMVTNMGSIIVDSQMIEVLPYVPSSESGWTVFQLGPPNLHQCYRNTPAIKVFSSKYPVVLPDKSVGLFDKFIETFLMSSLGSRFHDIRHLYTLMQLLSDMLSAANPSIEEMLDLNAMVEETLPSKCIESADWTAAVNTINRERELLSKEREALAKERESLAKERESLAKERESMETAHLEIEAIRKTLIEEKTAVFLANKQLQKLCSQGTERILRVASRECAVHEAEKSVDELTDFRMVLEKREQEVTEKLLLAERLNKSADETRARNAEEIQKLRLGSAKLAYERKQLKEDIAKFELDLMRAHEVIKNLSSMSMDEVLKLIVPPPPTPDAGEPASPPSSAPSSPIDNMPFTMISEEELSLLDGRNWLSDTIIDQILALITQHAIAINARFHRMSASMAALVPSVSTEEIVAMLPHHLVELAAKGERQVMFIPLHSVNHWQLLVCVVERDGVSFYNYDGYIRGAEDRLRPWAMCERLHNALVICGSRIGVDLRCVKKRAHLVKGIQNGTWECGFLLLHWTMKLVNFDWNEPIPPKLSVIAEDDIHGVVVPPIKELIARHCPMGDSYSIISDVPKFAEEHI